MKITIDDVRGFLAVYETGAFKGAADRLSITSSALTQRVQKLESYLGARLFDRSTRNVEPRQRVNAVLSIPLPTVALPWGSRSINNTVWPR